MFDYSAQQHLLLLLTKLSDIHLIIYPWSLMQSVSQEESICVSFAPSVKGHQPTIIYLNLQPNFLQMETKAGWIKIERVDTSS